MKMVKPKTDEPWEVVRMSVVNQRSVNNGNESRTGNPEGEIMSTTTQNSHKSRGWKVLSLVGIAVLAVAMVVGIWGFFGRSEMKPNPAAAKQSAVTTQNNPPKRALTTPDKVPAVLKNAGELGENIYDAAKAGDWKTAEAKLQELATAAETISKEKLGSPAVEGTLGKLEKTIPGKDKTATLVEANRITLEIADLTAKYDPAVPVEVVKLDYYGRELEIWAAAKNTPKLQETAKMIHQDWNSVKSKIESRGGPKAIVAFDSLVVKMDSAKTPNDYALLATPILDEVDNLEKVFG